MLVLIGRSWESEFESRSTAGERDFVRVEIERALARKIPVVPILLDDAPVPPAARLPASIRPLLELQATRLRRDSFDADAKSLIDGVQRSITLARGEAAAPARPERATVAPTETNRTENWIKVDAKHVHGSPGGRFLPGNSETERFSDHDAGRKKRGLEIFSAFLRRRISRRSYWLIGLLTVPAFIGGLLIAGEVRSSALLSQIVLIPTCVLLFSPSWIVTHWRAHDIDRGSAYAGSIIFLTAVIAVGVFVVGGDERASGVIVPFSVLQLLVWLRLGCAKGTAGPNQYGAEPPA
jgi:uncharacterized membrane protein YhaH (DUF805 family)